MNIEELKSLDPHIEHMGKAIGIQGVTIPDGSIFRVQDGDFWRVINGPDKGQLLPMNEDEKAFVLQHQQNRDV